MTREQIIEIVDSLLAKCEGNEVKGIFISIVRSSKEDGNLISAAECQSSHLNTGHLSAVSNTLIRLIGELQEEEMFQAALQSIFDPKEPDPKASKEFNLASRLAAIALEQLKSDPEKFEILRRGYEQKLTKKELISQITEQHRQKAHKQ